MIAACLLPAGRAQVNDIVIRADQKFQIIDNFAASDCWSMQKIGEWITPQKERIADLLFSQEKGIGLSAWRFNIGAGINRTSIRHPWRTVETFETAQGEYDWSRQAKERWFLEAARQRGVDQFIAFVNSPPGRMTRNGLTNCTDGQGSTNLKQGFENQYAVYLVDILKHFRDTWDISFDYISPVNEPQWEWNSESNQEGNRAGNEDIKRIVNELHPRLKAADLETGILIMESGDLRSWYQVNSGMQNEYGQKYGEYLGLVMDPVIQPYIGKLFCGHSYWSDRVNTQLIQDRENLAIYLKSLLNTGWKYWMTEYAVLDGPEGAGGRGRDLTMKTALDVARVIHYDLTILQASAWQWWTAVSPEDYKDGLIYTDYMQNPESQNIIESKLLWAFGNFSRFIRPGYVRIGLSGANDISGLLGSAYLSPDENEMVVVIINMASEPGSVSFSINGLKGEKSISQFSGFITSDMPGDDLRKMVDVPANKIIEIPGRSVVTLTAKVEDENGGGALPDFDRSRYHIFQNYPNPFNGSTTLPYYLPESSHVSLAIYNTLGEVVQKLVDSNMPQGIHYAEWNGKNLHNKTVSTGIYMCILRAGHEKKSKKIIYIQ